MPLAPVKITTVKLKLTLLITKKIIPPILVTKTMNAQKMKQQRCLRMLKIRTIKTHIILP